MRKEKDFVILIHCTGKQVGNKSSKLNILHITLCTFFTAKKHFKNSLNRLVLCIFKGYFSGKKFWLNTFKSSQEHIGKISNGKGNLHYKISIKRVKSCLMHICCSCFYKCFLNVISKCL